MLLGGLWHGANWTFVVWGGIHGAGLSVERFCARVLGGREQAVPSSLTSPGAWASRIVVFHLVCLGWVFFRAPGLREAATFLRGLGSFVWVPEYGIAFRFLAVFTAPLFLIDVFNEARGEEFLFETSPEMRRVSVGVAMMAVVALLAANQLNAFIYFRF
jgi:alginate O-acetyltransferase complex protein AlgI